MDKIAVTILLAFLPKEFLARAIVLLFRKLADSTGWTRVDDKVADFIEKCMGVEDDRERK